MIKFRAWDKRKSTYTKVHSIDFFNQSVVIDSTSGFNYAEQVSMNEVVLEQYTGLKDDKGVDIYENDYVRLKGVVLGDERKLIGVVKMLEGSWMIVNDKLKLAEMLWDETAIVEVAINVHENPDLLEQ